MSACSTHFHRCLIVTVAFLTVAHFGIFYFSQCENDIFSFISTTKRVISVESAAFAKNQIEEVSRHISLSNNVPPETEITINKGSSGNLTEEQVSTLEEQRLQIELKNYNLQNRTLDSLLLNSDGIPLRTIIFTTWRSGSNFLGQILQQNAATFYYPEPFAYRAWTQFRNGTEAEEAVQELRDLINCEYANLDAYLNYTQIASWVFRLNSRVGQHCQKSAAKRVCRNPVFLSQMCKLFPFQAVKLTRMRLQLGRQLLEDPRMNVRLIYLIRDPRGSLQSRRLTWNSTFCTRVAACSSAELLCSDLQDNYETAKQFSKEFPDRFMIVRYENLALDPIETVKRIYNFSQWEFNYRIQAYVEEHTNPTAHDDRNDFTTYRESKDVVFKWREKLDWSQINSIQSQCLTALSSWGYKLVRKPHELQSFNPLGPFNIPGVWNEKPEKNS